MNLVVLDDVHVVLNVREDRLPLFKMGGTFVADVPAIDKKDIEFKINYISRWAVSLLGNLPSRQVAMTCGPSRYMPYRWRRWRDCVGMSVLYQLLDTIRL